MCVLLCADLTWVNVRSADEAWRVLTVGQSNQSFASTHLNHNSSRRYTNTHTHRHTHKHTHRQAQGYIHAYTERIRSLKIRYDM